jgi:hypothetical protein
VTVAPTTQENGTVAARFAELQKLVGFPEYWALEKKYQGRE